MPIITAVRRSYPEMLISCDTFLSPVAEQVLDDGADLINDISAGTLQEKLSRRNAACVQMHTRETPATMNKLQHYADVTADAARKQSQSITNALDAGVKRWIVIADPGIGFTKTAAPSKQLLHEAAPFHRLSGHFPLLLGVNRK
ncbi:Dihydropteroate synthase [Gracilariopsis chorda]|uniref:Dihydropteroate synthase n=1 Tax=Gracilariopsis chorda TaxID=448386 RepID=A0A2V3IHA5_9FLOR|nr:Dihydropteroate synthase [Gracilariopsis chorda]|eukprot:PXF41471.1 Dihydropteroate synthase [Gracilariopsis chorda]